jgi:TctA family transporter
VEVEIRPILNSVTSHIRQVLTLTISLLLLGLLSGCLAAQVGLALGSLPGSGSGGDYYIQSLSGVLCTAEDSIGVKYRTAPNNQRVGAMQAITEHCVDGWVETRRVVHADSLIVYASCLQSDGSPAVSPKCTYVDPYDEYGESPYDEYGESNDGFSESY